MLRFLGALGFCCIFLTGCLDSAKQAQIAAENEKVGSPGTELEFAL